MYGRSFIAANFLQEVTGINAKTRSPALNKVLENILELYLVKAALDNMNNIFRVRTVNKILFQYSNSIMKSIFQIVKITDEDVDSLQARLEKSLKLMRPNAVAICDGFDFPDRNLLSTLGCFDGNVYERIFEEAKNSSLNKEPVPRVFHTHLKPFMKSKM